ncbi:MAG: TolC family protein [Pseudomonadota bacterium]
MCRFTNDSLLFMGILMCLCTLLMPLSAAAADNATVLSLGQSIAIALEQNPGFKIAGLAIQAAEHRRKAAGADFLPKVGTSYSYSRLNEPPRMKLPAGDLSPQSINAVVGAQNIYQWGLHVVQPLFTGGELYNTYKLEKLGVDVARLKNETARNALIYHVKAAYFTILKAQKLREVTRQAVAQIMSHEKTAQNLFEQEMLAKNDLLEAQVRLAQAEQDLVRAEQGVDLAKAAFNTVLHQNVNTAVEVDGADDAQNLTLSLDDYQRLALQCRPVIGEIDITIQQAQTSVKLAQGTYLPRAFLLSSYSRQGNQADVRGTIYQDPESWNMSISLDWTFWEWSKKDNVVGEQRVKLLEAQEVKKEIIDTVMLQVKAAWLACQESWKNIGVSRTAIERAEENFRIYQNRFNQQMSTTTDVLDAQTLLTHAKSNYHTALYDYLIARAALENAIATELK